MRNRVSEHIRANVVGYIALFCFAMSGVAQALPGTNSVDSGDIKNGQVMSVDIKDGQVKATDIGTAQVGPAALAPNAVSSQSVADDSLTGADIQESTLNIPAGGGAPSGPAGGDLSGSYPNPSVANNAVTLPKLAFDPATQAELDSLAAAGTLNSPGNPVDWTKLKGVPAPVADGNDSVDGGDAATLDGLDSTDFAPATHNHDSRYYTKTELSSPGTLNSTGNPLDWTNLKGVPAGFADGADANSGGTVTQVDSGTGLAGGPITGSGTLSLASGYQLPQSCANGQVAKFNGSGAWNCANDTDTDTNSGGTVTSVGSSTGLSGGPITGSGSLSIASGYRLPQGCANGKVAKSDGAGGWSCADDNGGSGTVTQVDSGTGLAGGPITGSGTLSLASAYQLPQGCANGKVAKSNGSGSWTCADDNDTPANSWHLGGNAGTDPANDFVGTTDSSALNLRVNNVRALRLEPVSDGSTVQPNVIGGLSGNAVTDGAWGATIAGGGSASSPANTASDAFATVGGGAGNQAGDGTSGPGTAQFATVAGGSLNQATGAYSAVPGGSSNTAAGFYGLAAGRNAKANHLGSFVWGDSTNSDVASTAADQVTMRASGGIRLFSSSNTTGASAPGLQLVPGASALATLGTQPFEVRPGGTRALRIEPGTDPNIIGGNAANAVTAGVVGATIAGGGSSSPNHNRVTDNRGFVGGGTNNRAGNAAGTTGDASNAVVVGGAGNAADNSSAFVGGGQSNLASGLISTIGGGVGNEADAARSTIAGGNGNVIGIGGANGTIGGGESNSALDLYATVGGGFANEAGNPAAVVAGGQTNMADATNAAIGGGTGNSVTGSGGTVPGGQSNVAAGATSFAAGNRAQANDAGSFVWGDSTDADVVSAGADTFTTRAAGGYTLYTDGAMTSGVELGAGSGTWSSLSDRRAKTAIAPVDGRKVLTALARMPVSTWRYRTEPGHVLHMGPMAQDFSRAFGLGPDNRHITSVDSEGVALAAIQGLNERVDRLAAHGARVAPAPAGDTLPPLGALLALLGAAMVAAAGLGAVLALRLRGRQEVAATA